MVIAFLHGFMLALALILPLGPQNTFVISQGATHRQYRQTLPVVLTAAMSDTVLIVFAVLGVNVVLVAVPALQDILTLLGIFFLVWMGIQSWRAPVANNLSADGVSAYWTLRRRMVHAWRASLLNPHAILDTVVVIGGGAALYAHPDQKIAYTVAAVTVSWLWFFLLALAGRFLGRLRNQASTVRWINRSSAGIMWVIAARYLIQLGSHLST